LDFAPHCARRYDVGIIAGAQLERRSEWHRCQRPGERRGWNQSANVSGAVPFGPTVASTPEEVSFILTEPPAQLQNIVESGIPNENFFPLHNSPHSTAVTQNINALTSYLSGFGITTTVLPDMIDVNATGTAGEFDAAALGGARQLPLARWTRREQPAEVPGQTFHGPTTHRSSVRLVEVRSLRTRSDELLTVHE